MVTRRGTDIVAHAEPAPPANAEWTPRVRRITAPNVSETGKLTFIRSLIGEQRFDEAAEELRGLLETNPRSYQANLQLGRLLEREKKFDSAVEHFEAARAANPTQAEAPILAGNAYLRLKDIDRAGEAFEDALRLDNKRAATFFGLAQVHFRRDQMDEAKVRLQQALAFDPQLKQARTLMARIHNKQGDDAEAKREIEDVLSTQPNQPRATAALARIHMKRDEPDEAIALLDGATDAHQDNAELWGLLGRARLAGGDYAGAEEALRKSLKLDPRQRPLVGALVEAFIPQGKLREARGLLDRLPDAVRRSGRVQVAYGKVFMAGNQFKQAAEAFRAALLRRQEDEPGDDADDDAPALTTAALAAPAHDAAEAEWKSAAERFETLLNDTRRPPGEGNPGNARRKSREKARRQAARAART
jgi:tetratricopeptide (TPR) repeat protein